MLLHKDVLSKDPPLKATAVKGEIVAEVNKTSSLVCYVRSSDKGNPDRYFFTWTRVHDPSFIVNTSSGVFNFTPSSVNDEDTYRCTPENSIGSGLAADIALWVQGKINKTQYHRIIDTFTCGTCVFTLTNCTFTMPYSYCCPYLKIDKFIIICLKLLQ